MTPDEAKALWEKVKANLRTLDACAGPHDFESLDPAKPLTQRWRCRKCDGDIDGIAKLWYERGLAHGLSIAESSQREARALHDWIDTARPALKWIRNHAPRDDAHDLAGHAQVALDALDQMNEGLAR